MQYGSVQLSLESSHVAMHRLQAFVCNGFLPITMNKFNDSSSRLVFFFIIFRLDCLLGFLASRYVLDTLNIDESSASVLLRGRI